VINAIICPMRLLQRITHLLRRNASHTAKAISEPIPQVTLDDVERIVCRDFTADDYATVTAMLKECGLDASQKGAARVQLAALRLANGSVQKLRSSVDLARRDDRDVLSVAEYPAYLKIAFGGQKLPEKERRRIIDEDWRQYQEWLRR